MIDAYPVVKQALDRGSIDQLKRSWKAHPELIVETGTEEIRIERHVLEMLEHQSFERLKVVSVDNQVLRVLAHGMGLDFL